MVFLDKGDKFYPSDMAAHISNTHPTLNFTSISDAPELTLDNLNVLNDLGGDNVYLASTPRLTRIPHFLYGQIPNQKTLQTKDAVSCVIALAEKENGKILDAFYIYFYAFNEGPNALGHRIGNHLGDW